MAMTCSLMPGSTSLGSSVMPTWFPGFLRDEPIAHPRLGSDVARLSRIGFELAAQLRDENAQIVTFVLVLRSPDLAQQLLAGDQASPLPHQRLEQLPFGRREPDLRAIRASDHCRGEVDDEVIGDGGGLVVGRV